MNIWEFNAFSLASEINLDKLATYFEINKKYRWEDPLVLTDKHLEHILLPKENLERSIYLFYFGAAIFINFTTDETNKFIQYLKTITTNPELKTSNPYKYLESYTLRIEPESDFSVANDALVIPQYKTYHLYIISLILAKSVSLEKLEINLDNIFDDVEQIFELMEKGRFTLRDRSLSKMAASIMRFKYTSISNIMLLDEPDIVWENDEAASLYEDLSNLFELKDRYSKIRHKSETLLDITEVFSNMSYTKRSMRLEWAIIILIAIEIFLYLFELISR